MTGSIDKWEDLEIGSFSILESKKECIKRISLDEIDLIIVPGIGFDKKVNRIEHGIEYFDELLKDCNYAIHIGRKKNN